MLKNYCKKAAAGLFCQLILCVPMALVGQNGTPLSRFTLALEVGTGAGSHSACYETWGYYRMGSTAEYRLSRGVSLETGLHYIHLEGAVGGYGNTGLGLDLDVIQQMQHVSLLAGPAFHFPRRRGFEMSLIPKAGVMMNHVSQDLSNYGRPFEVRRYKPALLLACEAGFRLSWWLTERLAFESSLGYFANFEGSKSLALKSVEKSPPGNGPELPETFVHDIGKHQGAFTAINLTFGMRFRL